MLKQVQHDGRGRYKISDVGGTKYRTWALQNIGRGQHKLSDVGNTIHPAKGLKRKAAT
jgi:hypothetical protein